MVVSEGGEVLPRQWHKQKSWTGFYSTPVNSSQPGSVQELRLEEKLFQKKDALYDTNICTFNYKEKENSTSMDNIGNNWYWD